MRPTLFVVYRRETGSGQRSKLSFWRVKRHDTAGQSSSVHSPHGWRSRERRIRTVTYQRALINYWPVLNVRGAARQLCTWPMRQEATRWLRWRAGPVGAEPVRSGAGEGGLRDGGCDSDSSRRENEQRANRLWWRQFTYDFPTRGRWTRQRPRQQHHGRRGPSAARLLETAR